MSPERHGLFAGSRLYIGSERRELRHRSKSVVVIAEAVMSDAEALGMAGDIGTRVALRLESGS